MRAAISTSSRLTKSFVKLYSSFIWPGYDRAATPRRLVGLVGRLDSSNGDGLANANTTLAPASVGACPHIAIRSRLGTAKQKSRHGRNLFDFASLAASICPTISGQA